MQQAPSPTRFALRPGERLLGRAEVVADTPALAGVSAMLWVTERRVVLCRVPGRWLTLATVAAAAVAVAVGQSDGPLRGLVVALFLAVGIGRSLLRFRRVLAEAKGGEVSDVVRSAAAVGVLLRDGSTWRLRPARHLLVIPGPVSRRRFGAAVQGLLRLVGRGGLIPVRRGARA